jgi:cyclophilin family peptidyl-prolyl cis-trans isomerase
MARLHDSPANCASRSGSTMHDALRTRRYVRRLILGGAMLVGMVAPRLCAQRAVLDDASVRAWAALLRAQDTRDAQDTSAIDVALRSRTPSLRAAAARTVGQSRMSARYPALRSMLRSERDSSVAGDAAFALGLAADSAACEPLRNALGRPGVGVASAWALGELGARCGEFPPLLAAARAATVRAALLRVAGKWTPFPDSTVATALRSARTVDERWAALYAFARARRSAGAQFAQGASHATDARIRELAARLFAASIQVSPDSSARIARLDSLLRDPAPHVRVAAVRSLASYARPALAAVRLAWRTERDANVRVTMAQSIGTVAPDSASIWAEWWTSDTTHMVRRSLIASAWQAGAIATLRTAAGDSLASDPDFRIRIAMIDGAAVKNIDAYAHEVARRLDDPDARVRAAAVDALSRAGSAMRDSLGWFALRQTALHDADVGVRSAALSSMRRTASAEDLAQAFGAFVGALRDSSSDAREAALDVIASAWRRDSAAVPDSMRVRLRELAPSPDPLLRQRVAGVTPLMHWVGAPVPATRPLEMYEGIVRSMVLPALTGRAPVLTIGTERGTVRIALDGVRAPMTADHLSRLARAGYFNALRFHRVVPAFVAQGGDPRGDGSGGPGFAIRDELNRSPYVRGAVGMALSGPDTGGSQFFLTLAPQPHLDGHYTVFGRVVSGLTVMDALVQGDAIQDISATSR